jgi:phytoene dehydrogenase-like protein
VLTPVDIEKEYLITRGDNELGSITLDQLIFLRPVPGYARYRMPVKNLYLCSGSTHPGGGVMCISGRNAAQEILKDFRSGSI